MAWHLNDSKFGLAQKKDRHENVGNGFIGKDGFVPLLSDNNWQDVVGYLEVPGFDNQGPDKLNVEILKNLQGKDKAPL